MISALQSTLAVAAALAAMLAGGDLVATTLRPSIAGARSGRAGLAFVLGPCVVAWLLFVANLAHVPIAPWSCRALAIVLAVAWVARAARRRVAFGEPRREPRSLTAVDLALWALVLLPVVVGATFAVATPPVKDALVNWSLKVKVLFEDGTVRTPDLREPQRYLFHPNYPLLVPLAETFVCGVAGALLDHAAKLVLSLAHFGAALLALAALAPRLGARGGLAFAALVACVPHFYRSDVLYRFAGAVPSGYADPMFAALTCGAAAAVACALESRARRDVVLVGVFLGFALFTKNEGLPLLLALGAGAAIGAWLDRRRVPLWTRLTDAVPALLVLLAIAVPWFVFRAELPARDENYQDLLRSGALGANLWRVPIIVNCAIQEALAVDHHGLTWPLLAILLVAALASRAGRARLRSGACVALLVAIAGMAAVYAAVFVVTPLAIVDSLVTSIPRTFFQCDALALLLAGRLCAPRTDDA